MRGMDGGKKTCSARLLELRHASLKNMNREQWGDFVKATYDDMNVSGITEHTFEEKGVDSNTAASPATGSLRGAERMNP